MDDFSWREFLTPRIGWKALTHAQARELGFVPRPGHGQVWEIWRIEWLWFGLGLFVREAAA